VERLHGCAAVQPGEDAETESRWAPIAVCSSRPSRMGLNERAPAADEQAFQKSEKATP
jgi:hypothetical protein